MAKTRRKPPEHPLCAGLFTDLYELTMAQAYWRDGMTAEAVFELFFRELPENRNYVVASGLADILDYVEDWGFTDEDLEYLRGEETFTDEFLDYLRGLRFTGDIHALPEGRTVFPNEPIVQVVAPIIEAQILETFLLNQVHFQCVAASKCARVHHAAQGRTVVDFGSRRAHGADAALKAARATYLTGSAGTSNVLAGKLYGIPIFGTMAHSYIQAHDDERAAFEAFAGVFPETTLLVDTYDTLEGIKKVIEMARSWGDKFKVRAIRLDSGDLAQLAKESRRLLDEAGLEEVKIFASSGLDEYKITRLLDEGGPIDGFGVGTKMVVSHDAPDLDLAYKLVEYDGKPRMKLSSSKEIYPGRKQVFRLLQGGKMAYDILARHDERLDGEALLKHVVRRGERLSEGEDTLEAARERCLKEYERMPGRLLGLDRASPPYEVRISNGLRTDLESLKGKLEESQT